MVLVPDKVRVEHGLTINEKIIPWGAKWTKNYDKYKIGDRYKADRLLSNNTGKVAGLTIHNTSGDADAETYTRATYPNQNMKTARVHYYVDDKGVWQNLRDDEVGWHAGDGNGKGNDTTIGIEILLQGKAVMDERKAEANGILLAAILMVKHNLTIKDIYTHKHWSGKNCPINILARWSSFIKELEQTYNRIQNKEPNKAYRVQVGYFHKIENAENLARELFERGYDVLIKEEGIEEATPTPIEPPPVSTIKVGSKVKVVGNNYATGQSIPAWVKNSNHTVGQISGDRALLKEIVSWVYLKDLILQ